MKVVDVKISIDDERKMFGVIFSESGDKLWDIPPTTLREAILDARDAHEATDDDDDDDSLEIRVFDESAEYSGLIPASPRELRAIEDLGFVAVEHWISDEEE